MISGCLGFLRRDSSYYMLLSSFVMTMTSPLMGSSSYKPISSMGWDPFFVAPTESFTFQGLRFGLERVINQSPSVLVLSGDSELFWLRVYGSGQISSRPKKRVLGPQMAVE